MAADLFIVRFEMIEDFYDDALSRDKNSNELKILVDKKKFKEFNIRNEIQVNSDVKMRSCLWSSK